MPQNSYVLTTDSNSELPLSLAKAYEVPFVPMNYLLDDKEYFYDLGENTDFKWFFNNVRAGHLPTTSAYSPLYYVEYFRPFLEAGQDVLHVSFSSGMSATFSYIQEAVEELKTLYPDRRVVAVDTLSISGGAALLVSPASIPIEHPLYRWAGDVGFDYFPPVAAMFLLAVAVAAVVAHLTPFGRRVYAVGGGEASAVLMGVPVRRTKVAVYAISGG